jgi:exonuclease SbcD
MCNHSEQHGGNNNRLEPISQVGDNRPCLVAHLSDMHFSLETLDEIVRCSDFAAGYLSTHKVDAIVVSGDSTDHRLDLHSPATAALLHLVKRLADIAPTAILHGTASHEPFGTLEVFKTIGARFPVYVADQIKQVALVDHQWIESDNWRFDTIPGNTRALFSMLPSVNKGAVACVHSASEAGEKVGELVYDLLRGWAVTNLAAREDGIGTIGVSHGTVSGCHTEHGVPMNGTDFEFTTGTLFAAECSAFLLGHIHVTQNWSHSNRRIGYAGSLGRYHYGERDDKGFLIWSVRPASATCEFIKTPAKRLLEVDCAGTPDLDELRKQAADAKGVHVRIRFSVDEEFRHSVDRKAIEELFTAAGAAQVKIEARINPISRSRAAGITQAVTMADKLKRWAKVTGAEAGPLVERLQMLESMEPDEIVKTLTEPAQEKAKENAT